MAHIVEQLPADELAARHRAAQDATEARHFQAIRLPAEGRTVLEAAEVLAFVPRWVERLAARYSASGPEALGDRRRRNGKAASLLAEAVLAALAKRSEAPPEDGGLWSGPEAAAWMARRLGRAAVHPRRGRDALRRLGWPLRSPRPRHPRAATPARKAALQQSPLERWRGPGRRIPTARSRCGPRTSTASA